MENMVGWMAETLENIEEIQRSMGSMEATLGTILERLHAMQVAQELRNAKEDQKLSINKEHKTNEAKEVA